MRSSWSAWRGKELVSPHPTTEVLWKVGGFLERESAFFKCVAPYRLTMLQSMILCLGVHAQHKLEAIGSVN